MLDLNSSPKKVLSYISVGDQPHGICLSPDGGKLFVANYGSGDVSIIDTVSNTVIDTIFVGRTPAYVVASPDEQFVYVCVQGDEQFKRINLLSREIEAFLPIPAYHPQRFCLSPDGQIGYFGALTKTGPLSLVTFVVRMNAGEIINTYHGHVPNLLSKNGHYLWTTDPYIFPNSVAMIDVSDPLSVLPIWEIQAADRPHTFALSPDENILYLVHDHSNILSIIVSNSGEILETLTVGNTPSGVSVDPAGEFAYVSNLYSDSVSVIRLDQPQVPFADAGSDQSIVQGSQVSLDASGSYDPDLNYPLTYDWYFVSMPTGSQVVLEGADTANPTFYADVPGDYVVELVVTDALGLASEPDQVVISSYNTAPVADAGPDQAVIRLGSTVQLDGTESYDDEGDDFTYQWTIISRPDGSMTELSNPASAMPTLVPDVYGAYVIELVVADAWDVSAPDSVTISFDNVAPVAVAGGNQAVVQGDLVELDGFASHDVNGDPLTYSWSLVSAPAGSFAQIVPAAVCLTSFVADVPGEYIVSLMVNDGWLDSDPSNITVVAIAYQDAITDTLQYTIEVVNGLDPDVFKNRNLANALTNKLNDTLALIDQGLYAEALDKLQHDILGKTDGCALEGQPDRNDWLQDCAAQDEVYPLIVEAIDLLSNLI